MIKPSKLSKVIVKRLNQEFGANLNPDTTCIVRTRAGYWQRRAGQCSFQLKDFEGRELGWFFRERAVDIARAEKLTVHLTYGERIVEVAVK